MLKGSLDDFTLSDIFRLLSFTKKTGKLEVSRSAGEGNVFFRDGDVYFAQSSLKKEPLGQKLIRSGDLTEPQLLRALDLHASTGQRVGEILLDQGAITQDQLVNAVAEQIEDAAFDLLRWELGEFLFEGHERFEVEIPISVSVENLIMEASRRLDELDVIKRKIPSADVILSVAPAPPDGARQINISADEWRLLVLVDGKRTVGEVCETAGLDDFAGVRTLYGMIATGLLDIAHLGPVESEEVMMTPPSPVDTSIQPPTEDPLPEPASDEVHADGEDGALTIVRAPDEPAIDEAYESIPENLADLFSDEDVEVVDEVTMDAEAGLQETAEVPSLDETSSYELESEPVETELVAEAESASTLELLDDAVLDEADPDQQYGDTPLDEYLTPLAEADVAEPPVVEPELSAVEPEEFPTVEPDATVEGPEEFLTGEPEVAAAELEELTADEQTPAAEPDVADDTTGEPDLSEVIASGVPNEWFQDPQPQAPAPPAPLVAEPDPFLDDILNGDLASLDRGIRESNVPDVSGPRVDRAAVVRELAGLFSDEDQPPSRRVRASGGEDVEEDEDTPPTGDAKRRVEDDDQINKGLIGRFIDGVKGM